MHFRVVDCDGDAEQIIWAVNPEDAAFAALGVRLVRGTRSRGAARLMRAKVYWQDGARTNLVRLYQREPIVAIARIAGVE